MLAVSSPPPTYQQQFAAHRRSARSKPTKHIPTTTTSQSIPLHRTTPPRDLPLLQPQPPASILAPASPTNNNPPPPPPPLPTELVLDIITQPTTSQGLPSPHLLQVSPWINHSLSPKLYHTVILSSWTRIDQFKYALQNNPSIESKIKKLGFRLEVAEYPVIGSILERLSSSSLQALVLPTITARRTPTTHLTSLTSLTVIGPAYYLDPTTRFPPNVTHLQFPHTAPTTEGAIASLMNNMDNLTHIAFKISENPLPFQPDPTLQLQRLLSNLLGLGVEGGKKKKRHLRQVVIYLSTNADVRYTALLEQFKMKDSRIFVIKQTEMAEDDWYSIEDWSQNRGERKLWRAIGCN